MSKAGFSERQPRAPDDVEWTGGYALVVKMVEEVFSKIDDHRLTLNLTLTSTLSMTLVTRKAYQDLRARRLKGCPKQCLRWQTSNRHRDFGQKFVLGKLESTWDWRPL